MMGLRSGGCRCGRGGRYSHHARSGEFGDIGYIWCIASAAAGIRM